MTNEEKFSEINKVLNEVCLQWEIYKNINESKRLKSSASYMLHNYFFEVIKPTLVKSVIINLCKIITDSKKIGSKSGLKKCLTFERLIEESFSGNERYSYMGKLNVLKKGCTKIKEFRNMDVAHFSMDMLEGSDTLPNIKIVELQGIIDNAFNFYNEIYEKFNSTSFSFNFSIQRVNEDIEDLTQLIQNGLFCRILDSSKRNIFYKGDKEASVFNKDIVKEVLSNERLEYEKERLSSLGIKGQF